MKNNAEITSQDRLREAGVRVTVPRLRVYEYLLNHRTHPTCDDIYKGLKGSDSSLSLASVYNVTEKLSEVGLVNEIVSPDGQKHYDGVVDFHGHFFCRDCGRIMDVSCCKDFSPENLEGSRIDSVSLIIRGLCKDCVTGEDA